LGVEYGMMLIVSTNAFELPSSKLIIHPDGGLLMTAFLVHASKVTDKLRNFPLIAVILFASGCMSYVMNLPASTTFNEKSPDAIIVLQVIPTARISMVAGTTNRDGWSSSTTEASYAAWSEDGRIVLKVKPRTGNETYGIVEMTPDNGKFHSYKARKHMQIPTFHAVAGQITYVGAIKFEVSDDGRNLAIEADNAPDDGAIASRFISRKYPKIHAKVITEVFSLTEMTDAPVEMPTVIMIPILR
jgi:hypothetical protein